MYLDLHTSLAANALSLDKLMTETYEFTPDMIEILDGYSYVRAGIHPAHSQKEGRWATSYSHGLLLASQSK